MWAVQLGPRGLRAATARAAPSPSPARGWCRSCHGTGLGSLSGLASPEGLHPEVRPLSSPGEVTQPRHLRRPPTRPASWVTGKLGVKVGRQTLGQVGSGEGGGETRHSVPLSLLQGLGPHFPTGAGLLPPLVRWVSFVPPARGVTEQDPFPDTPSCFGPSACSASGSCGPVSGHLLFLSLHMDGHLSWWWLLLHVFS